MRVAHIDHGLQDVRQVSGFIMVSLGNMHPSQQMWRSFFVTLP